MKYNLSESHKRHEFWQLAGSITTQCDAGDYDGDNRADAEVEALADAKKVILKPDSGVVAFELRFRSNGTAADQHVLQLFASAGVDHYMWIDQITIDLGTQLHSGIIYFCDTVAQGTALWITDTSVISGTANHVGRYVMNCHGYSKFWMVASTLDTAGGAPSADILYIDWKPL